MTISKIEALGPELTLDTSAPVDAAAPAPGAEAAHGVDFGSLLAGAVGEANHLQNEASAKAAALARGATDDLHGTMISVKEAEISMKLVGSIRNRLLDAFHELWRINL